MVEAVPSAQLPNQPPGPDATQAWDEEQGPAGGLVHATEASSPGATPQADQPGELMPATHGTSGGTVGLDAQHEQGAPPAPQQQEQDEHQQLEPMELGEGQQQQRLHGERQGGVGEAAHTGLLEVDGSAPMDTAADAATALVEAQAADAPLQGQASEGETEAVAAAAVTAMEVEGDGVGDSGGDVNRTGPGVGVVADMEVDMGSEAALGADGEGCQQTGPWEQQGQQQVAVPQEEAQSEGVIGVGAGEGPGAAQASGSTPSVGGAPVASPMAAAAAPAAAAAGSVGVGDAGPGSRGMEGEQEQELEDDGYDEDAHEVVFMVAGPGERGEQAGLPGACVASEASLQGAPQDEQQQQQGMQGMHVLGGLQQAAESEVRGVQQSGHPPVQQGDAVSSSAVEAPERASLQEQRQQQLEPHSSCATEQQGRYPPSSKLRLPDSFLPTLPRR